MKFCQNKKGVELFISEDLKPECQLTGINGNVFNVIGTVSKALRNAGLRDKAVEFSDRAVQQECYDDVLTLCFEYVDVL